MKQKEIEQTIAEIKKALGRGDYDSQKQKEKVQQMIDDLYYPATALEDQRYTVLGESLYVTTHLATNSRGQKRSTLPMLRASKEGLSQFMIVAERLGILPQLVRDDVIIKKHFTEEERSIVVKMADDIDRQTDGKKLLLLEVLATVLAKNMLEYLADDGVDISINSGIVTFIRGHTKPDGRMDYRAMGQYFYDMRKDSNGAGTSASLSFLTSMLSWTVSPDTPRKSQKARGIQAMTGDDYSRTEWLWQVKPSLFLSLEDATEAGAAELMASMRLVFGKVAGIFQTGVFVRTCPATPRPGALENEKAHSPTELLNAIRKLGRGMLDKTQPDYDPEGCLCVMPFIQPSCSAVAVVGHKEIVMGGGFDDVTAGGGSNIVIPISDSLASHMKNEVRNMKLDDGMDAHEIEMVWYNKYIGMTGNVTQHVSQRAVDTSGYDIESTPFITQVRGLHEAKESLTPPPMIDGEALTIRGNVPTGSIEQQTFINVGSGDLAECINLEQMAQNGELPAGLVVYAPSGSSNAHVAGVGIQWEIPVIYGIMPRENGTIWTEIKGWVTDIEGAEPKSYNPSALADFYLEGCKDGDRFWNYGYHVLSQFFHTYLTGPRNDPRFEAYLGGFYTTWILKATLAVAMGEGRHAYQGNKAKFWPIHGLIHTYTAQAIAGDTKIQWNKRNSYYRILKHKEVGLHNLATMLETYVRIYSEPAWPSGSYGGKNYKESVQKAVDVAKTLRLVTQKLTPEDKSYAFKNLLGKVNTLENAVHNCSFFFNKFVANKKWFDIGTRHHGNTAKLEHQYHVLAALHYRFYRHHVDEPHRISQNIYKVIDDGFSMTVASDWTDDNWSSMSPTFSEQMDSVYAHIKKIKSEGEISALHDKYSSVREAVMAFSGKHAPYCEDCDSYECGCYSPTTNPLHYHGTCGLPNCPKSECQQARLANNMGIGTQQFQHLEKMFNTSMHVSGPIWHEGCPSVEDLFVHEKMKIGMLVTDTDATVFTEPNRPEVEEDGNPYSLTAVPVENVPIWTKPNRNTFQDWPDTIVFKSKYDTVMHTQPAVNTLYWLFKKRLDELTDKEVVHHYVKLRLMPIIPTNKYDEEFLEYIGENDLWDLYSLCEKFQKHIRKLGEDLADIDGKQVGMLTSSQYSTLTDWRHTRPQEFFLYILKSNCTNRIGTDIVGSLTYVLQTLETALGREFVEEVIANGK